MLPSKLIKDKKTEFNIEIKTNKDIIEFHEIIEKRKVNYKTIKNLKKTRDTLFQN